MINANIFSVTYMVFYIPLLRAYRIMRDIQYDNKQLASGHREDSYNTISDLLEIPYYLDRLAKERLNSYNVNHKPNLSMSKKLLAIQQETEQLLDTILVKKE